MKLQRFIPILLIVVLVIMPVSQVMAQGSSQRSQCQQFVRRAYSSLGTNCLRLESGMVCYGHEEISGMVLEGLAEPADFFAEPGYRGALMEIARVTGSPFSLADEIWGLSKLNVQVFTDDIEEDDPETLDDNMRDILLLLIGDVEVESAVEPAFDDEGNLVIDAETPGPMQEIFLRNGYDAPGCPEVPPPLLLVQGAPDADTQLTINGLVIQWGAGETNRPLPTTAIVQVLDPGNSMRILTLAGMVKLNPGAADEMLLPPGHWTVGCLDEPQDRGLDRQANDRIVSCALTAPELITEDMLTQLEGIEGLPGNVLNRPIILPAIIRASGVGGVIIRIIFGDFEALDLAREACEAGELPPGICQRLFD